MLAEFSVSLQQIQDLMALINIHDLVQVTQMRQHNHTYRIIYQDQIFYLKLHTKDWYPPNEGEIGYSVAHETSAWRILARHGLATPEIVVVGQNSDNPLKHAFFLTREVPGVLLVDLIQHASPQEIKEILYAVGAYLRCMHAISFPYAGYILGDGPTGTPDDQQWQHFTWTLKARQHYMHVWIHQHSAELSAALLHQLEEAVESAGEILAVAYVSPRFTQGDCKPDQIIIVQENGSWQVSAFLDMEVASAGDCITDLVSFCASVAQYLSPTLRWWQPLFEGYGSEPDFNGFRLRLLCGWYPYEANIWPGVGENGFGHVLQAEDWEALFSHAHLP